MFDKRIFEAIEAINPSERGELEITVAIQWLVEHGYQVYPHVHTGWWIDTGRPVDLLTANDHVLEELQPEIPGSVDAESSGDSRVTGEQGAEIIGSTIRRPAIIGEGARNVKS